MYIIAQIDHVRASWVIDIMGIFRSISLWADCVFRAEQAPDFMVILYAARMSIVLPDFTERPSLTGLGNK